MVTRRSALAAGLSMLAAPALGASSGYADVLSQAYGGRVDPAAAFARLQAVIRAIQARGEALVFRLRGVKGPFGQNLRIMAGDAADWYADSDAGRDHAVADMNARIAALAPALKVAFGDLSTPQAAVQRMSAADVAAGRGGYRVAPSDGRPGAYYVDLRDVTKRPAWTLPSVAFHEVIPGHLLQLPLQAAARPPDARVKAAAAYFEAWGTYAEQLAADLGAYRGDPAGEIGYLQWRLFRLGRGLADIGLNAMRWSRDRAISEMRAIQGFDVAFITIEADVARMAAEPGKVAAEALGALDLAAWRSTDRATWPAYHRIVLTEGPWPFGELEKRLGGSP